MHYFLTSMDTTDPFTCNTLSDIDLTVFDLKNIAQDRISEELFWRQNMRWGEHRAYFIDENGQDVQRYVITTQEC